MKDMNYIVLDLDSLLFSIALLHVFYIVWVADNPKPNAPEIPWYATAPAKAPNDTETIISTVNTIWLILALLSIYGMIINLCY